MKRWLPITIFLLAFGLRLFGATHSPPSPYWEETALGYDAYSILKTGRDHHGNVLPLVAFPSFGDYKPSLYFYSLIPSIGLLGLNTLAVRFPAILASALTVLLLFFLVRRWTNNTVATWSAILLSFQPWSWQVGRVGFETNLATTLLVGGVLALTHAFEAAKDSDEKKKFLTLSLGSAALFVLSMYAYHGARLLAPLFAVTVFALNVRWSKKPKDILQLFQPWLPAIVFAALLTLPILAVIRTPVVQQRIAETSIFTLSSPVERSNLYRELSGNSFLSRVIFHRNWFWFGEIFSRYASHLSPAFLFIGGDTNPRHTSQWFGALFPWEILTLAFGFAFGTRHFHQRKHWRTLLALLLLSPVAAAFTLATPHALRALPLSPWLAVFSGIGAVEIIERLRIIFRRFSRFVPMFSFTGVVLSWLFLAFYFFTQYRYEFAAEWQYGYQELFNKLVENKKENEPVFVSRFAGRPAMYLFFTQKIDPRVVQAEESTSQKDQLERLTFQNWSFIDGESGEAGLHAQKFGQVPDGASPIGTVSDLDGKPIWIIYRR